MEISELIKTSRQKQGLTQQALADKIYVTRQTISKWKLGKSIPDQVSLNLLYKELHIETETQKTITQSLFGKEQAVRLALVLLLSPAVLLLRYGLFNLNQVKDKRLTLLIKCLLTLLLVLYLKSLKDSVFYIACAALFVSYLSYRLYQLSLEKEHKDE
ncbi:helix-turn-helix transcriptional regulator [Streptococcus parauberis]|uniref:helix-turn-helix transcriptional regulator n=1 Tax=Streptococcus parauberis TaxID=1348 RepID=UPI000E397F0F|nr:helix-turn-helix transcriptional regulator [Streptococcus parauberis]RFE01192.1 helix-turn-helix protein [Streptococcus parauberis]